MITQYDSCELSTAQTLLPNCPATVCTGAKIRTMAEQARSRSTETYLTTDGTSISQPVTGGRSHGRSRGRRPATALTSTIEDQDIICAISESRGISPTVGLAFVNLSTSEAVLCQICDSQTYVRTCHKLKVFNPSEILYMSTVADTKLISIIRENLEVNRYGIAMQSLHRRYWSETNGHEYVQQLAFPDDLESLKVSIGGNYFAVCSFAAVCMSYDSSLSTDVNRP
jgi:DNA mismatch repair protein MSH4